jgi:hypothetical protein
VVDTYVASAESFLFVREQNYNAGGVLQYDVQTDYDPVTCTDCGLELRRSDMRQGIDFASGDFWAESVSGDTGLVLAKVVLTGVGTSQTINEGEAGEETFDNCIDTWEERRAKAYWNEHSMYRVHCAGVGFVMGAQKRLSDNTNRYWELTSYTVTP